MNIDKIPINIELIEHDFLLSYLKIQLLSDPNQINGNKQNVNYLKSFKIVFDYYQSIGDEKKADKIKKLAFKIANDQPYISTP